MGGRSTGMKRQPRSVVVFWLILIPLLTWPVWGADMQALRVCADPDNLPFSNQQLEGFENQIAALVAGALGTSVTYAWQPQRRGFVRSTLNAKRCDVILGVPTGYELVLWTHPYYRSTFVVVSRKERGLHIASLEDPSLRHLRIGVHQNSPVDILLGDQGLVQNVIGYSIWYDGQDRYAGKIIEDVVTGKIDVAIVWGPGAGYFVKQQPEVLAMEPIRVPRPDDGSAVYAVSMGVREGDNQLKARVEEVITTKQTEIYQILENYGVPLVTDQ
jgi:mxaJ protein